jgi:hypothetical protein
VSSPITKIMKTSSASITAFAVLLLAVSLAGLVETRGRRVSTSPAGASGFSAAAPGLSEAAPGASFGEIAGDSIMSHVNALVRNDTRSLSSAGSARASRYIEQRLLHWGWAARLDDNEIEARQGAPIVVRNVVADYPAGGAERAVLILCTHYDSRSDEPGGHAPGADDNASGTAVLLEVARILASAGSGLEDLLVRMVFFGGEEDSMLGSAAFVRRLKDSGQRFVGAINIDMIGFDQEGPKDFVIFTNEASLPLAKKLERCSATVPFLRCETTLTSDANSDHGSFWNSGLRAVSVWEGYDHNPWYHTGGDTPDKLSPPFMAGIARTIVCAIHSIAREQRSAPRRSSR